MSWKPILSTCGKLLGPAPFADLSLLGNNEATVLINRVKKLASLSDHPFVSVLNTHMENSPYRFAQLPRAFNTRRTTDALPESMVIPMIGQATLLTSSTNSVNDHKKLGEIYASVNLALALHRSITELPSLSDEPEKQWLETMESGNKLAVLAGDILLATASVALAEYRIPKVVELISGAITDAIGAEFSDLMLEHLCASNSDPNFVVNQWFDHIEMRHGALLGECCGATLIINSPNDINVKKLYYAKRFGSAWGCLARLIDERKAVRKALASDVELPKSITAIGYTQSGLPEPTLADLCLLSLGDSGRRMLENMYADTALRMADQMRKSIRMILPRVEEKAEIQKVVDDAMHLLIQEAL